ncbi:unnamed protein product [Nyctereutes procyonoides]|uniref:(raccoon dog) hypothetical protein n=1 Tax=Nyctereutes procyonoides TaxID=34880 RepID=A0A811ZEW3_NYCPR|nr:unnamed protein product [Nyctereutes procyonoides]
MRLWCLGLQGQRAKSAKFVDDSMIHSRDCVNHYVDTSVHHIMLPWDPSGNTGPEKPQPGHMSCWNPKMRYFPPLPPGNRKVRSQSHCHATASPPVEQGLLGSWNWNLEIALKRPLIKSLKKKKNNKNLKNKGHLGGLVSYMSDSSLQRQVLISGS